MFRCLGVSENFAIDLCFTPPGVVPGACVGDGVGNVCIYIYQHAPRHATASSTVQYRKYGTCDKQRAIYLYQPVL